MSLSSLIVQRGVASMRQVEEALARQVIHGGDLVTNLLEVARLDEGALTQLVGESVGIQAASPGPIPAPNDRAMRLVPGDVADKRGFVPLAATGDVLTVAVAEPLANEVLDELAFALGLHVDQRIVAGFRIREALSAFFGLPLDKRIARLLKRVQTATQVSLEGEAFAALSSGAIRIADTSFSAFEAETAVRGKTDVRESRDTIVTPPPPVDTAAEVVSPAIPPAPKTVVAPPPAGRPALVVRHGTTPRAARRRRGPMTLEGARAEIANATDRDSLLDLFFDFARQYFEYSALFILPGDIAEGRDAYGPGASREKVVGLGVPLDLPGLLATARDRKTAVHATPDATSVDGVLLEDLGRPTDATVVVVPVVLRTRVVALLYGDSGELGVDLAQVADVLAFAVDAGKGFERILVKKKKPAASLPPGVAEAPDSKVSVGDAEEIRSLVQRLVAKGADAYVESELTRRAAAVLPLLMEHFPGPLVVSESISVQRLPRVAECGPMLRILAATKAHSLPFVVSELLRVEPARRFWAAVLLAEIGDASVIPALAPRILDEDERTRKAVFRALGALGRAAPAEVASAVAAFATRPGEALHKRLLAVFALGETNARDAVPPLLALLEDPDGRVAAEAGKSLVRLTHQDFDLDVAAWRTWWESAKSRSRIEWIIDTLVHPDIERRREAIDELRATTNEYFTYAEDAPERERLKGQERYRDWWAVEGLRKFGT